MTNEPSRSCGKLQPHGPHWLDSPDAHSIVPTPRCPGWPTPEQAGETRGGLTIEWPGGAEPDWCDKRTRAVALELALKRADDGWNTESILRVAQKFYRFIEGEA